MGDAETGKKIFTQKYAQCHIVEKDGKHKTSPNLWALLAEKQDKHQDFLIPMQTKIKVKTSHFRVEI